MRSHYRSNRWTWALLALLATGASFAGGPAPSVSVGVEHKDDAYIVVASLVAPVVPADAWAVLADFDRMASFMPNLASSRVLQRTGRQLLVAQRGEMVLGVFRLPFESLRIVELSPPQSIRSTQLRGNFRRIDSATTFAAVPVGTRVDYRVEIVPSLWLPETIAEPMLRAEVERQFSAILREIVRRKRD